MRSVWAPANEQSWAALARSWSAESRLVPPHPARTSAAPSAATNPLVSPQGDLQELLELGDRLSGLGVVDGRHARAPRRVRG